MSTATAIPLDQQQSYLTPSPEGDLRVRRLVLVVEYQGTNYCGFQMQPGLPTVQGELEGALLELTGSPTRVRGASRTDSGAHARAMVVDFLTTTALGSRTVVRGMNAYLPADIKVRSCQEQDVHFNSRKDAISRVYRYTILNHPAPSPLVRDFSHWIRHPLDTEQMALASQYLVGEHDFAPLATPLPPARSGVRQVYRWQVWQQDDLVLIEAEANGFLPHQVRRTNGLLVEIGLGHLDCNAVAQVLDREMALPAWSPLLPARGLCLMEVKYEQSKSAPCFDPAGAISGYYPTREL